MAHFLLEVTHTHTLLFLDFTFTPQLKDGSHSRELSISLGSCGKKKIIGLVQ